MRIIKVDEKRYYVDISTRRYFDIIRWALIDNVDNLKDSLLDEVIDKIIKDDINSEFVVTNWKNESVYIDRPTKSLNSSILEEEELKLIFHAVKMYKENNPHKVDDIDSILKNIKNSYNQNHLRQRNYKTNNYFKELENGIFKYANIVKDTYNRIFGFSNKVLINKQKHLNRKIYENDKKDKKSEKDEHVNLDIDIVKSTNRSCKTETDYKIIKEKIENENSINNMVLKSNNLMNKIKYVKINNVNIVTLSKLLLHQSNHIYYLNYYYPRSHGIEHYKDNWSTNIINLKELHMNAIDFFSKYFNSNILDEFLIVTIPSSDAKKVENGMDKLVKKIILSNPSIRYKTDYLQVMKSLVRIKSKEKSAFNGSRNPVIHLETLEVRHTENIKGKSVLLLDDVVTTGSSMITAKLLLLNAGAKSVDCIALGRTKNYDYN